MIRSVVPHYKTDALLRRENIHRYDDRAYIDTNLIDAYDPLMSFITKHLPDPFYLEGDQRISLREHLGWIDELGSGVVNVNRFHKFYAPGALSPVFEEGDTFKVVIPLETHVTDQGPASNHASRKAAEGYGWGAFP